MFSNDSGCYIFGDFHLNILENELLKNGEPIPLTHKSLELLHFLVDNEGRIIKKEEFFKNVWAESTVDDSNLTQHIYRVRKVLENNKDEISIETISKHGYRFNGKVEKIPIQEHLLSGENLKNTDCDCSEINTETDISLTLPPNSSQSINSEKTSNKERVETSVEGESSTKNKPKTFSSINQRYVSAGIAILVTGLLASFIFYVSNRSRESSVIHKNQTVAVLPFKQIGNEKNERLTLGMADSIISKLGNLEEIVVSPTETIAPYAKQRSEQTDDNLFEIGEKLGVDILLTGTIQKENNVVRFNLRLYHVKNQRYLCSIKYDKVDSDTFNLQDKIAEHVLQKFTEDLQAHKDAEKNKAEKSG